MADSKNPEEKTLVDMEIESRQTEIGSDDDDQEHKTDHSDELSIKADPAGEKRTHGMLFMMGLGSVALILLGLGFLLLNLESSAETNTEDTSEDIEMNDVVGLKGRVFYVNKQDTAATEFYSVNTENLETETFAPEKSNPLQSTNDSRNPTWQISSDGRVVAYQLANQKSVEVETSIGLKVAFQDKALQSLDDWLLTPDGSNILALVNGSQIAIFNVQSNETIIEEGNLKADGVSQYSRIYYGVDGLIRRLGFSGAQTLQEARFSLRDRVFDNQEITSPRFPNGIVSFPNSLSPDGQVYVFKSVTNSGEILKAVSLNSKTVRTIYVATSPKAGIQSISWAPDSRTLMVSENEGPNIKRLVKLDTGPLTFEVVISSATEGINTSGSIAEKPTWAPDSKSFSFFNGGNIWHYDLSTVQIEAPIEVEQEAETIDEELPAQETPTDEPVEEPNRLSQITPNASAPSATTIYGWYLR